MVAGIVGQLFLHVAFNWTAGSTSTLEAAQCSTPNRPSQRSHAMPQMGATLNLLFAAHIMPGPSPPSTRINWFNQEGQCFAWNLIPLNSESPDVFVAFCWGRTGSTWHLPGRTHQDLQTADRRPQKSKVRCR